MRKLLENYETMNFDIQNRMSIHEAKTEELLISMELAYRSSVVETLQSISMSAPESVNHDLLGFHYQIMTAFLTQLTQERKFGPKVDEAGKKKRETALAALVSVLQDGQHRFATFCPANTSEYRKAVDALIGAVLPAWIEFRQNFIYIENIE